MKPTLVRKPVARATVISEHHLNLRCPDCGYYAKTTRGQLRKGRLECPIHRVALATKAERGEHRGRKIAYLRKMG